MPLSINQALGVFPEALRLESKRSEVLASNIANADTPGYKARDLDFKAALNAAGGQGGQLALTRTSAAHIEPGGTTGTRQELLYQVPSQPSLDGNTVDLQRNQAEFGQTAMRYEATLTFLNGRIQGLRQAIKGQ
ncbi:MAG: flagellar basal body rod protein FlgB [Gammaproteobacteria bacterium]|jgi:flagellar basal-body rod protein FlgB